MRARILQSARNLQYDLSPLADFGAQSIMTFAKEVTELITEHSGAVVISLGADGAR